MGSRRGLFRTCRSPGAPLPPLPTRGRADRPAFPDRADASFAAAPKPDGCLAPSSLGCVDAVGHSRENHYGVIEVGPVGDAAGTAAERGERYREVAGGDQPLCLQIGDERAHEQESGSA